MSVPGTWQPQAGHRTLRRTPCPGVSHRGVSEPGGQTALSFASKLARRYSPSKEIVQLKGEEVGS